MNSDVPLDVAYDEGSQRPPVPGTGFALILYIAGRGPNSVRAMANLDALVQARTGESFHVEVVDVLREPQRALRNHVLVTPTLVKQSPPPLVQIAGDLSDGSRVLHALGLAPISPVGHGE